MSNSMKPPRVSKEAFELTRPAPFKCQPSGNHVRWSADPSCWKSFAGSGQYSTGPEGFGLGAGSGGAGPGPPPPHLRGSGPCTTLPLTFRFFTSNLEASRLPQPQFPGTQPVHCEEYRTPPHFWNSLPMPGPCQVLPPT